MIFTEKVLERFCSPGLPFLPLILTGHPSLRSGYQMGLGVYRATFLFLWENLGRILSTVRVQDQARPGLFSACLSVILSKDLFTWVWLGSPSLETRPLLHLFREESPPPQCPRPPAAGSPDLPVRCLRFSERLCVHKAPPASSPS